MKVLVAGGGAAGMYAAARLAEAGIRVTLIEHNEKLGKKLYITGKGRCNFTNNCTEEEFLSAVVSNPKFLYSAIYRCPPAAVMDYFRSLGLDIKTERGRRVFPESDRAADVIDTLARELRRGHVQVLLNTSLTEILTDEEGHFSKIRVRGSKGERDYGGDALILAMGGRSYPSTGSRGDGYLFAKKLGLSVKEQTPSLVPFVCREEYVKSLQGLSLKNVRLKIRSGKRALFDEFGELLFTHFGISGPLVLSASAQVGPLVGKEALSAEIDLKPAVSSEELSARFESVFRANEKKHLKNVLPEFYPRKMVPVMPSLAETDPEKPAGQIGGKERDALVRVTKHFPLTITALRGYQEAIVTKGGVRVGEVRPATMEVKSRPGIYIVGEMLDLDAYTGGYNLQIAWCTAHAAAADLIEKYRLEIPLFQKERYDS